MMQHHQHFMFLVVFPDCDTVCRITYDHGYSLLQLMAGRNTHDYIIVFCSTITELNLLKWYIVSPPGVYIPHSQTTHHNTACGSYCLTYTLMSDMPKQELLCLLENVQECLHACVCISISTHILTVYIKQIRTIQI